MTRKASTQLTSETFTASGDGTTVNYSHNPVQSYSVSVKGTGASADAWTVLVQVSLDDANWTTILTHDASIGDGVVISSGANLYPGRYVRLQCSALTLGGATNIVAQLICLGPQK